MIKCRCSKNDCTGKIWFEEPQSKNYTMLFLENDVSKRDFSIYLDANGLLELIKEAQIVFHNMTRGD